MASKSVLLALNSLSHDGMVHLTAEDHEQLGAIVRIILPLATEVMTTAVEVTMGWNAVNSCG